MVLLMKEAHLVLTDSGGIQEEAPALGKPVLVLRETTERPEAVAAGTVALAGTGEDGVYAAAKRLLTDEGLYNRMARAVNPYGDGRAAIRIRDALLYSFGLSATRPESFAVSAFGDGSRANVPSWEC
ncbi:MAG: UDP-N-acetylglucosamine 2-epimerase, partial [Firmicutes bacterium]|nr:UDP-N-acetylglucosamine 2-epimerase [Bacillota bacterium]